MKQGIHLGPRPARPPLLAVAVLFTAAALILGILYVRADREVAELGEDVARRERELTFEAAPLPEERARVVASRLRAVLDAGIVDGVPPTTVLRFVTSALPEDVVLSSLAIDGSPPERTVTLEAEALGGERVSELQRRLSASPWVAKTTLLEERRLEDGGLAVRLHLEIGEPEGR
ncbi:MAG: PilN domain-containing protein [Vicinamibacteria bacterium]